MAIRVLADENIKFTILTTKPADIEAPTASELNAGIDASCLVDYDTFKWTATASEQVGERLLCEGTASQTPGVGNYDLGFTVFRWFAETGTGFDITADRLFEAVKVKGTELYGYVRRMNKKHSEPWVGTDEIALGGSVVTDTPQSPDNAGSIKYAVPLSARQMVDFGVVSGSAPTPPPAWAASTAYPFGADVTVTGGTLEASTAGTSGTTEPVLPASVGGTVTDGTVTWTRTS